jgi:D-alanyl-D-alanine carboxypeptidase
MSRNIFLFLICLIGGAGLLPAQPVVPDNSGPAESSARVNTGKFVVDLVDGLNVREKEVRAGLLYDAERRQVVWEKDMYYAYPIASLTKMMVALLAAEDVRAGKFDWSDEVKVERLYRKPGRRGGTYKSYETYTLESLVQLAMIPSNNQACSDIGIYLDGDVATFVKRMNAKAQQLQMFNTFYSNPSGLPAPVRDADNHSSPHDLLLLCLEMLKYEEILKITSIGYAEVSNDKRSGIFRNHNHLVINYENEVDGLKTGFTKRAKFCLAATSRKDDYRMVSIVLGVDGPYLRNEIVASMLNNYYEKIGCGPMSPTAGGPVAKKSILVDPAKDNVVQADDGDVTYKTVWTKQKQTHHVKSGETLSLIAKKYKSTYQQIRKWNGMSNDRIYAGQRLTVYVNVPQKIAIRNEPPADDEEKSDNGDTDDTMVMNENDQQTTKAESAESKSVTSVRESTPQKVQNNTPQQKTASSNITNKSVAAPGKSLSAVQYTYYVVQPGDTLWSIAKSFDGVSADDIKKVNRIYNPRDLKPGTKLKIKTAGS